MSVLDAPALPPPALVAPAPREVSFGRVAGVAPAGTRRLVVRAGGRVLVDRPLRRRAFSLTLELPARSASVRVIAVGAGGRRTFTEVDEVYGLPPATAPRAVAPRLDAGLAAELRGLASGFAGTSGGYVQDLRRGRGAAWNAGARFPAASTLKLAVAVTVLARLDGKPAAGSYVDRLLRAMLVESDNESANELEVWLGGSTGAGSALVNATMAAAGLTGSDMYGGYLPSPLRALARLTPIPVRVESQPAFGEGKHTTAADLAALLRAVYLGAGGKGPLPGLGVTASEARHLLWRLAGVGDRGKLGRRLPGNVRLLHKAGWIENARHDAGLVFTRRAVFVAAVLTWRADGVGSSADELAGRVAAAAAQRYGQ